MHFEKKILFTVIIFLFFIRVVWAGTGVLADPDNPSSGIEFYGVPSAKIGEHISFWNLYLGAFLESRNEKRFSQGILPNHNWRGFASLYYGHAVLDDDVQKLSFYGGFEHESAHPTMGFYEHNDSAYEMIYDNLYRNINLNSMLLRGRFVWKKIIEMAIIFDYQFYFCSKNTPELHNTDLSQSHGLSAGFDIAYSVSGSWRVFLSVFDRCIFRGYAERDDDIYFNDGGSVVTRTVSYPVINNVNTVVVKAGMLYEWKAVGRSVGLYGKMLYGNIFGFVDSRERRLQFYCGLELLH
ncbi:MAG: hypothetical protein CVV44_10200 [Spirochaetae bacterium HGW-Spirochaetae-1]|jgi:hypothetical protein|nr:MAG: hypothetical protein CVV44_10200 [Spirochaetae bacterium HGW-Spirochaetae-1]